MVVKILFWNLIIPLNFYLNYLILCFFYADFYAYNINVLKSFSLFYVASICITMFCLLFKRRFFEWKIQINGGLLADFPLNGTRVVLLIHRLSRQAGISPLPHIRIYSLQDKNEMIALVDLNKGPYLYLSSDYLKNISDESELKSCLAYKIAELGQGNTLCKQIVQCSSWPKNICFKLMMWFLTQFIYPPVAEEGPAVKRQNEINLRNDRLLKFEKNLNNLFRFCLTPLLSLLSNKYFRDRESLSLKLKDHLVEKLDKLESVS